MAFRPAEARHAWPQSRKLSGSSLDREVAGSAALALQEWAGSSTSSSHALRRIIPVPADRLAAISRAEDAAVLVSQPPSAPS